VEIEQQLLWEAAVDFIKLYNDTTYKNVDHDDAFICISWASIVT
jgi:hypothetical protein